MKKTVFAMVVAAMAFAVNANAQFSVGVGYANESIISKEAAVLKNDYKGYGWEKTKQQLNGFYVEAAYDWAFASVGSGDFILQPGVRYYCLTNKSYSAKANIKYTADDGKKVHVKSNEFIRISNHLIDIPLNVKYAYEFIPGTLSGYVFAGPSFSFGIAANHVELEKGEASYDGETEKSGEILRYNGYNGKFKLKTYNKETEKYDVEKKQSDEYRIYDMFDLKLALGLGVTVSEKVDIKFGYNIGLLNRSYIKNKNDMRYSTHSNILHFGVAYKF